MGQFYVELFNILKDICVSVCRKCHIRAMCWKRKMLCLLSVIKTSQRGFPTGGHQAGERRIKRCSSFRNMIPLFPFLCRKLWREVYETLNFRNMIPLFPSQCRVVSFVQGGFYSPPSTEGVESTRGNSACLFVCLSVITFSFDKYSII